MFLTDITLYYYFFIRDGALSKGLLIVLWRFAGCLAVGVQGFSGVSILLRAAGGVHFVPRRSEYRPEPIPFFSKVFLFPPLVTPHVSVPIHAKR